MELMQLMRLIIWLNGMIWPVKNSGYCGSPSDRFAITKKIHSIEKYLEYYKYIYLCIYLYMYISFLSNQVEKVSMYKNGLV